MILEKLKSAQKLEQILLNFIDVLRINILVVDSKGKAVMVPKSNGYGFYGSTQWGALQNLGTPKFLKKFESEGNYLKSVDIFGFQSFAIPIPIGEYDIGYLIVGPVVLNKQFEHSLYEAIARDSKVNFSDLLDCLGEVRIVTFNTLKSILDLLFELSRYALRMNETEKNPLPLNNDQIAFSDGIFINLLDLAMSLTQAECGSIMLLNRITNELNIQVFKGIELQKLQHVPVQLGESIAGLAVLQKESFVIIEKHPDNRIRHLLKKPELKCSVILPIVKSNKDVLGVMNISTRQSKSRLATHPQQMLKSLIEIASGTVSSFL